jgi:hypothetical protein
VEPIKHLSTKQMTKFSKHINTATGIIDDDDDTKRERSAKVTRGVECCGLLQRTLYWEAKSCMSALSPPLLQESWKLLIHWLCKRAGQVS